ncbi:MAG: hypothetical protein IH946_04840, partial [Bacteroidetes bacterium]|nr:hypothetical protein [Bacteroidota bacterium]
MVLTKPSHATVVRFNSNVGSFDVRMYDTATPLTVANIVTYVNDGDFDDTGEQVYTLASTSGTFTDTITLDTNVVFDTTVIMRVISDWDAFGIPDDCNDLSDGQAEDYGLVFCTNGTADFTADSIIRCLNDTVIFTDTSTNALEWSWDFGDGGTAIIQDPSHSYG